MKCNFCGAEIADKSTVCSICGAAVTAQNLSASSMPMQMSDDGYPMVYVAPNLSDKDFNKLPQLKKAANKILVMNILLVLNALSDFGSASQSAAQNGTSAGGLWIVFLLGCIVVAVLSEIKKKKGLITASMALLGISGIMGLVSGVWFCLVLSVVGIIVGIKGMKLLSKAKNSYSLTNTVPDYSVKKQK